MTNRLAQPDFMWAFFGSFGRAMWRDRADGIQFDYSLWCEMTERMAEGGLNALVIDLGEALVYPSHRELAVKGSWEPERMVAEVTRLEKMGILAIPKINFSTCHDAWLKDYAYCVSTPEYYAVCADVIRDVGQIFSKAPLLHLGFDEENWKEQKDYPHVVIRQGELWWHDILWFFDQARAQGFRPWIWSDSIWNHREEFLARMPKDVLQSNWYYFTDFSDRNREAVPYKVLAEAGYDQVPCSSNYRVPRNCSLTVEHCRKVIPPETHRGFLHAPWGPTVEKNRKVILEGVALLSEERKKWRK